MPSPISDPHVSTSHVLQQGLTSALALFKDASRRVPAYADFLKKHGVKADSISSEADFKKLPRTDKPTYVTQYSLEEMSWDGVLSNARYISTSSGSTGVPFFWPRGLAQDAATGSMFRNIFSDVFDLEGSLLFVNSFGLGTWIAGFEFYNATKWAGDQGQHTVLVTPGIDKAEAINQIKKLAPLFDRVVLAGYPPFVKDILTFGTESGVDWAAMDLRLLVAGEAVSIIWKQRILEYTGKKDSYASFVNAYGMAESGVVAHDTPLSQLVREHLDELPFGTVEIHDGLPVTGFYQHYPELRYFEGERGQALALTANAGLPIIRYDTRDTGGVLDHSVIESLGDDFREDAQRLGIDLRKWRLPFVYLNGRKDLSISFYALNIFVENIKYILERSEYQSRLTGLFTMSVEHTNDLDQQFIVRIELADHEKDRSFAEALARAVCEQLCLINSEYSKLFSSIGDRARPLVILLARDEFQTVPGRKHKWVKRA